MHRRGGLCITTMTRTAIETVTEGLQRQIATAWRTPQVKRIMSSRAALHRDFFFWFVGACGLHMQALDLSVALDS